ncbi:hypothetical protein O3M35_001049 [Rhynocoris fuscipes]|uniref:Uncharacterized protein n=1 Tax=Rhynocoris fuscipes TaxID=488301 RepID=A0AAW1DRF4_9HEMI
MSDISNITEILNDPLAPHSIYDDDDKSTYVSSTPGDKYFWKEKNNMKKYEHYMNKDRHDIEKEIYPADLMRATSRIQEFLKKNEESGKLKFEDRLLETIQTNHRQLQEDVKLTVEQFRKFVEGVEEQARLQQIEKMARDKKDWPEYRAKEKEYHETLKKGLEVMNKFAKAISMEPYAVDLKNHLWKYNEENIGDAYCE